MNNSIAASLESLEKRRLLTAVAPISAFNLAIASSAMTHINAALTQSLAAVAVTSRLTHNVAALSQPRGNFAAVTVGTQAVFAGGEQTDDNGFTVPSSVVDIYDTATGRWSVAALTHAGHPAVAVVGDIALFATGNTVDLYNSKTGLWSKTVFTHSHDYGTGVTVVGDKAIFAGGDRQSGESSVADIYDAATGRWSTATLSRARWYVSAVTIGDKAIFAGGYTGNDTTYVGSKAVDIYDSQTRRWSTAQLSVAGSPWTLTVGRKVVFYSYDALDIYDADTGRWSTTELPRDHYGPTVAIAADKIVFAGGYVSGINFTDVYDTTTGQWSSGALSEGRWGITAVTIGTRAIFAAGDSDDGFGATNSVDIYDGATGKWSTATLSAAREGVSVTTIGTQALFAGGYNLALYNDNGGGDVTLKTIDVYDAASGQWSTASLSVGRDSIPSITVNGRAIFAGGQNDSGFSGAVDIYAPGDLRAPTNPSPAMGAGVAGTPTALSWSISPGASSYDVYLDDTLVANVVSNHLALLRTLARGLHTWQAVARNGTSVTGSPRWSFTVGAPAAATNPMPRSGGTLSVPPATFSWDPSAAATSYDVYLDGALLQNVSIPQCVFGRAIDGGTHTWQVIARNAYTTTPGPKWTFTTPSGHLVHTTDKLSQAHNGLAATTVGHLSLFAGDGTEVVDIYDALTGQWSKSHLSQSRSGLAATTVGPLALFAGGNSDLVDIYDSSTGRWSTSKLSQAHSGLVATTVGRLALFAGGDSDVVEIYNAPTGRWSTAKLSQQRTDLAATAVGDLALFAGGYVSTFHSSDVVDVFNAVTGQWTTARLSKARGGLAATAVGNLAFFAGGSPDSGGSGPADDVDIYDAGTGRWSTARLWQARGTIAAATAGAKAMFAGGWSPAGASNVVDVYDTVTGKWSLATLSQGRTLLVGTSVGNQALFAGGTPQYEPTDAVDFFADPSPAPVASGSITSLTRRTVSLKLVNSGNAALAGPFNVDVYGATPQAPSVLLGTITVAQSLAAGAERELTIPVSIGRHGDIQDYHLSLSIDGGKSVSTFVPRVGLTPPTAALIPPDPLSEPRPSYLFSVAYHDDHRIDAATLDDNDIVVTGPNGFSAHARFISESRGDRGSTRVANYAIDGPADHWDSAADGDYLVQLQADQVTDTNGSSAPPAALGTLSIEVPVIPAPANLTHTTFQGYFDLVTAITVGDKAFFAGGGEVQIYDAATDQWSSAPLSAQRWQMGSTTVGTKAIFAGGSLGAGQLSDVVDIFDTATGQWSTSTLPKQSYNLKGVSVGQKAIFLGGRDASSNALFEAYILDTVTGQWSTVALPGGCTSAATVGAKVIFPGGSYYSGRRGRFYANRETVIYDDSTGEWSAQQSPATRFPFGFSGDALPTVAGAKAVFVRPGLLQIYDTDTGQWSIVPTRMGDPLAAAAAGSKVLFTDGHEVEIYDSVTNRLSSGQLSQRRVDEIVAASLGTRVFFAGGWLNSAGPQWLGSDVVDVYDTVSGQWSATRLVEPRVDPLPVAVANRLIFAGGWNPQTMGSSGEADLFTDTSLT